VDKAKTDTGSTPLIMASVRGHLEVVHELPKHGAEVGKAKGNGATPLIIAS
jgi:ankyrin repeat protein